MKTNPKPWPIMTLHYDRSKINLSDDRFQRGPVWTRKQEQLLIDTILKKLDIPKLYFWVLKDNSKFNYSVVDGQQRLTTIWRFLNNDFKLSNEYTPKFAGKKFDELPMEIKNIIFSYPLTIVEIEDASLDDIRDLFLRLQNGTTLKSSEKRVNLGGKMPEFIIKQAGHQIFTKVLFKNTHRDFEQILAQCMMIEINNGPTNTQDKYLNKMYKDEKNFDENCKVGKKFIKVLNYMNQAFDTKMPELKRFNFISFYLLISQFVDSLVINNSHQLFKNCLIDFWQELTDYRNNENIDDEQRINDFDDYILAISSRTDSLESIKSRHDILSKWFLLTYRNIERFDNQRNFSGEQRLTIYRRDKGICWHCLKYVEWSDYETDHRPKPYSLGGRTIVENGACAHSSCNLRASNRDDIAEGWLSSSD